ncbi:hypothetical protein HDU76_008018, partial [Blyttiomyces sp. JEL0837]
MTTTTSQTDPVNKTFSDPTYNADSYRDYRPTYERELYDIIMKYHKEGSSNQRCDLAVDVASGTGQATVELAERFNIVIGIEPSEVMRKSALQKSNITYIPGTSSNLPRAVSIKPNIRFTTEKSVDLITAAQAIHWFDMPKFYNESPNNEENERFSKVSNDISDMGLITMKGYWDDRRALLDEFYSREEFVPPFNYVKRILIPSTDHPNSLIKKQMTISALSSYLKTWSSYKTYLDKPEKEPNFIDPVDTIINKFTGSKGQSEIVTVEWPLVLIMARS